MLMDGRACGSCGLLVICAGNRSVIPGLGAKVDAEPEATAAAAAAAEMTMTMALTMTMAMINTRSAKVPRGSSMMVTRPRSRQGPSGGAEPTGSDMARRGRKARALALALCQPSRFDVDQSVSSEVRQGTEVG